MKTLLLLGLLAGLTLAQNNERSCPCTYANIWLDIIALIDNSASMTAAGLAQVQANLATIAGQLNISQTPGYSSRVSLVSYHSNSTVVADLSTYADTDTLVNDVFGRIPSTSVPTLNIEAGLQSAGQVLASRGADRANYKTVILLYASAYSTGGFTDPLPAANNLKESGTPIITIAFSQADTSSQVDKISALASSTFAFNSTDTNLISEVFTALCQVNCYCPNNFVQYANNYANPTRKFGECLRYVDIDAAWTPAKFACQNLIPGGFLVQEFTPQKHQFNQQVVRQSATYAGTNVWHLGLSYNGTGYNWEGPNGTQTPLGNYTAWATSFPNTVFGNAITNYNSQWENENPNSKAARYVCQAQTCDTQNYCATIG